MGICVEYTFTRMGICVIICKKSMIYGECIPLSGGEEMLLWRKRFSKEKYMMKFLNGKRTAAINTHCLLKGHTLK